ncbi:MAG: Na/Pi cotransporter family protein, partial [Synergistetes bacterium]|nr:Na/Pi cotransporter family protein [Synergistota bacterium]
MWFVIIGIIGGLVVFLQGVNSISSSLKEFLGVKLRPLFSLIVKNKFFSFLVGMAISVATQSSSIATALLVSMVNSKMMLFEDSISLMIGASVGTIVAVQIIAFDIKAYFPVMLAVGFSLTLIGKSDKLRVVGNVFLGFGMIFLGMKVIGMYIEPIKNSGEIVKIICMLRDHPLWVFLISMAFTMVIQSSAAVMAIAISMASQGIIGMRIAIPVILGLHVGSASVVLASAIGSSTAARRLAWTTFLYKIIGGVLGMLLMPLIINLAEHTSTYIPRQMANAFLIIVSMNAVVILPWSKKFARVIQKFLPVKETGFEKMSTPRFINKDLSSIPQMAIYLATQEIIRVANITEELVLNAKRIFEGRKGAAIRELESYDEVVDTLTGSIVEFMSDINAPTKSERREIMNLIYIANELEYIEDIIERGIVKPLRKKSNWNVSFSEDISNALLRGFSLARNSLRSSIGVMAIGDINLAKNAIDTCRKTIEWERFFRVRYISKITRSGDPKVVRATPIIVDIANTLRAIADHSLLIVQAAIG